MSSTKRKPTMLEIAFAQAVKSIYVRFWRQVAAALGVVLGIAFFASVRTSQALTHLAPSGTADAEWATRLNWLSALSLVMCLVGISNSMLMSVTERYREIGTLKCLGASDRFVVFVFFLEALVLGVLASLVGTILGIGVAIGARAISDSVPDAPDVILAALRVGGISMLVGVALTVVASVLPAMQAARMPAAAALRVEV
ncbi:FtsX-like permease family protein [Fimbriimonadia bacterium ATM]|nr:MAG: FtsX-like permease family protein [Armatimonadota bacterium]MBC6969484.1 hypothetical protein [Armatimonadota bacterium]MCE7899178.1 hypothetical protein [Armatimonadetes bacterium ATM1]MDL1928961.1 FtsX-like permease family protein [Fimbriimonadia bacterium ATM]RIJ97245.1 MAG: hypothetical protein DCC45_04185 [Armatimonadota bacterium]